MKRGEVWTVSGAGYAGKPRLAVIVQSDLYEGLESLTLCLFTTNDTAAPDFRIPVIPSESNGLTAPSWLMANKMMTVSKKHLGRKIGTLAGDDMTALNHAMIVFLGIG